MSGPAVLSNCISEAGLAFLATKGGGGGVAQHRAYDAVGAATQLLVSAPQECNLAVYMALEGAR